MSELPEIVFNLELLKIKHDAHKHCNCSGCEIVVDAANRLVYCGECGAVLEPFQAIMRIVTNYERVRKDIEHLLQQRKQIANYKPWLVTIKDLEKRYRGRKMLPTCPHCHEAFYLEELTRWTNEAMERRRRELAKGRSDMDESHRI